MLKQCKKCNENKSPKDFYCQNGNKDGRQSVCKVCENARKRIRYQTSITSRLSHRNVRLKSRYGITLEEYFWLLQLQKGHCMFCLIPHLEDQFLAVDHDHAHHENTKQGCKECIRGLLCRDCNRIRLPWVEFQPYLQSRAIQQYLNNRPFLNISDNRIYRAVETPVLVSN